LARWVASSAGVSAPRQPWFEAGTARRTPGVDGREVVEDVERPHLQRSTDVGDRRARVVTAERHRIGRLDLVDPEPVAQHAGQRAVHGVAGAQRSVGGEVRRHRHRVLDVAAVVELDPAPVVQVLEGDRGSPGRHDVGRVVERPADRQVHLTEAAGREVAAHIELLRDLDRHAFEGLEVGRRPPPGR
jgi:hypothetical protein